MEASANFELVTGKDLEGNSFEGIILNRFKPFIGKNYIQICEMLGIEAYQSKSKYADAGALIASNLASKRLASSEEFLKSGIIMKTVRLKQNGMPKESMSFKNIDHGEVYDNDDWLESDVYEIFTSRFIFVVFRPIEGETITVYNNSTKECITEQS